MQERRTPRYRNKITEIAMDLDRQLAGAASLDG
jgi:hypothetical protein